MITPPATAKVRPYWHVDAKWLAGIALFFSLGACLLFYNLTALTERDRAVTISASIVAGLFSQNGISDEKSLTAFRTMAQHSRSNTLHPISEFPSVSISKHDALTLSAEDLRVALFSQITGPIYDLGVENAARQFTHDPKQQAQFAGQASALGLMTKVAHSLLQRAWLGATVMSLIFVGLLICFSAGWGRLVSPGMVLLSVSPIGSLAGAVLLFTPLSGSSLQTSVPANVAQEIGTSLSHSYLLALIAGIGLLIVAAVGKLISVLVKQNHTTPL